MFRCSQVWQQHHTTRTEEADALQSLEERIVKAVELLAQYRQERDAAVKASEELKAENKRLSEELETLQSERKQVRSRIEKLLGQMDIARKLTSRKWTRPRNNRFACPSSIIASPCWSTGDPTEIEEAANEVDELMHTIARSGNLESMRVAMLACLHLQDRVRTLEREFTQLRSSVEDKSREFSVLLDDLLESQD